MRIPAFLTLIIVISGIFFVFAMMVREANQSYDININSTEWEDKYDYSEDTSARVSNLTDYLNKITDPDRGFFSKLALGIDAIPYAVIAVPSIILESLGNGVAIATSALTALGIPKELIILVTVAIMIWGVFRLIGMFSRSDL